jgi:hypothetical protein
MQLLSHLKFPKEAPLSILKCKLLMIAAVTHVTALDIGSLMNNRGLALIMIFKTLFLLNLRRWAQNCARWTI